jgi:hypothetical protein
VKKVNPQSMVHLTEKPVELAVRAIQDSSPTGDNVTDRQAWCEVASSAEACYFRIGMFEIGLSSDRTIHKWHQVMFGHCNPVRITSIVSTQMA